MIDIFVVQMHDGHVLGAVPVRLLQRLRLVAHAFLGQRPRLTDDAHVGQALLPRRRRPPSPLEAFFCTQSTFPSPTSFADHFALPATPPSASATSGFAAQ